MALRTKLIAAFLVLVALTAGIGLVGVLGLRSVSGRVNQLGTVLLPSVQSLLVISEAQTAVDAAENALLARGLSDEARGAAKQRFVDARTRFEAAWKIYEPLPQTPEEAEVWRRFVPAWKRWWADHLEYERLQATYERTHADADYEALVHQALVVEAVSFGAAEQELDRLVEINRRGGDESTLEALALAARANTTMVLALLLAVLLGVALGLTLSASLTRSLSRIIDAMRAAAAQVAAASGQVSASSQQMASGASTQASNLEEIPSSLEE